MKIKLNYQAAIKVALLAGVVLLAGCVSIPESIKGTTQTPVESLSAVREAPELYIGQEGRFGGKVISVLNNNNQTRLEIAVMPLSKYDAAPRLNTPSVGRIYAYIGRFLEPSDFSGHYITVVGTITGIEEGKIDLVSYQYVKIAVSGYQRWNQMQSVVLPPSGWGYGSPWYPNYPNSPYYWNWGPWGYPVGEAEIRTYLTE
ncbi:Slp family lipoprotein [Arsenophonus sp.]|uniref:Slp family lipoprotein n=1 Tax=Arsenophonus sp. TaxID=1872640 RepID=UPI00285FF8D3|nr:Slp family lipoprotein [Arsenophonus sp.]MDR5617754.1 Slp family lipoprotein [Arsenophonus sp.]